MPAATIRCRFFSGQFDDPKYDLVNDPTSQAGITCTACHAITHVNSTRGNGDYVMEEPLHYPFAYSENPVLQFINNTLVKAKPSFHKQTFLKPFHKTAEFCSACHKVHLPKEVTHYKDFLRGQNHYDNYLLSGVSGVGARSFYYPEKSEPNCNGCHMPAQPSNDFGAKLFAGAEAAVGAQPPVSRCEHGRDVAPPTRRCDQDSPGVPAEVHARGYLWHPRRRSHRRALHAPLRPDVPTLQPGQTYLLETVVRTLKLGHLFTQGTVDSNEVWLEVKVTSGERELGHSGGMDDQQEVDRWAHFLSNFVVDRHGNRINRRNAQDIFVALYDHQLPPGAGQTVHYRLHVPSDVTAPVKVELRVEIPQVRQGVHGDRRADPRREEVAAAAQPATRRAVRERAARDRAGPRRDRVSGGGRGCPRGERAARHSCRGSGGTTTASACCSKARRNSGRPPDAFAEVEKLNRFDGPLNLARVFYREGRLDEAVDALRRAATYHRPPCPAVDDGVAERPGESRTGTSGGSGEEPAERVGRPDARHAETRLRFQPRLCRHQ